MKMSSVQLRHLNSSQIKKVLRSNEFCTKNSISEFTGLSLGTCSNILKELLISGEVLEIENRASTGGRPSRQFVYNKDFANVCIIYLRKEGNYNNLSCAVIDLLGNIVYEKHIAFDFISLKTIDDAIEVLIKLFPKISIIAFGIPGVVRNGIIDICDFPQIQDLNLSKHIFNKYTLTTVIENDVNSAALGYYEKYLSKSMSDLAYIYYPTEGIVGAGIIINGNILKGHSNFAGEVSFLPLGVEPEHQGDLQKDPEAFAQHVAKTILAINCIVNPQKIVLSGFCFTKIIINAIKKTLEEALPKKNLPKICFEEDIHENYVHGLISLALNKYSSKDNIFDNYIKKESI